jgi:hypothetical protein
VELPRFYEGCLVRDAGSFVGWLLRQQHGQWEAAVTGDTEQHTHDGLAAAVTGRGEGAWVVLAKGEQPQDHANRVRVYRHGRLSNERYHVWRTP